MFKRSSILIATVLIVGGFTIGKVIGRLSAPVFSVRFSSEIPLNVTESKGQLPSGQEVVMVFVGSPDCGFCKDPELAPLVREAATSMRDRAFTDDARLVSVGLSPTWVPGEGWRFLQRIMNFGEVVIGRNWLNSEIVELGWAYPYAEIATPQIIVYRQEVVPPSEFGRASISREIPTVRVTGLEEIRRWVRAGCPLEWSA